MNEFEKQLQGQPLRRIPDSWREEILRAAEKAQPIQRPWWSLAGSRLTEIFWPHPKAWGALATVWAVLLLLNFESREASKPSLAVATAPMTAEAKKSLKENKIMLAELIENRDPAENEQSKVNNKPKPQTMRRIDQAII